MNVIIEPPECMLYTRSVDKTVGAGASAGDVALPQLTIGDTGDKE